MLMSVIVKIYLTAVNNTSTARDKNRFHSAVSTQ